MQKLLREGKHIYPILKVNMLVRENRPLRGPPLNRCTSLIPVCLVSHFSQISRLLDRSHSVAEPQGEFLLQ